MKRVKCFMIRHQAEGIITDRVYASTPTDAQLAEAAADLEERHGDKHPKTGEPYWVKPHEAVLEVPDSIAASFEPAPDAPPKAERTAAARRGQPGSAQVGVSAPKVSGTGTVTNPGEKSEG